MSACGLFESSVEARLGGATVLALCGIDIGEYALIEQPIGGLRNRRRQGRRRDQQCADHQRVSTGSRHDRPSPSFIYRVIQFRH